MFDVCIKGGLIVNHNHSYKGDLYVKEGKIAAIGTPEENFDVKETINAAGMIVVPGFIDPHSHLNDPGYTEAEDFYTGTCSAAAGGITTVMEHPLTDPLPANKKTLIDKRNIVDPKAVVDYALFGACTPDNFEDVVDMIDTGAVAFKAFLTSSPEMPEISDFQIIHHMKNLKDRGPVLPIHCENENIIQGTKKQFIEEGRIGPMDHCESRPEISEAEAINRMCLFAEHTKGKVHIVHCSIPEGIDIVENFKKRGANVTVETCPHYLYFDQNDVEKWGVYAICNPPIRTRMTVEKLWEKVLQGNVDFIGSDHAPYTFEEKEKGSKNMFNTPAGFSGIQTGYMAFFSEGVNKRKMPLEQFVAMTSTNAAKRYNVFPKKGILEVGSDADIVIINQKKKWTVTKDQLFYKMKWTPYMGKEIEGKIEKTIVRGTVVYSDGDICVKAGFGEYVPAQAR